MRVITASVLLSFLAVAGCSSKTEGSAAPASAATGGSALPTAVSGTRLRAKLVAGGGARELVGFHDSERNEDCTFQHAEDGHMRCLPPFATANPSGTFSDAACQVPVGTATSCAADVKYGVVYTYGNCGQATPTELRKALDPTAPLYVGRGTCIQQPATPATAGSVPLGEVIPWTAFVDAIETVVPGGAVSEKVLVASDGARQHLGYRDEALSADCTYTLMADGVTRCVPDAATGNVMYSDSACTSPSFVTDYSQNQNGSCGTTTTIAPNLWLEPSIETCGGLRNVYSLGGLGSVVTESGEIFSIEEQGSGPGASAPKCTSNGTSGSGSFSNARAIRGNLNATLPVTPRVGSGSDRLVPAFVWPADADTLSPGWHDNERKTDCTFALASDGKMRCLPTAAAATLFFTDGACKSPNVVAVLTQAACIGPRAFARVVSTTCPPTTRIFALGGTARNLQNVSTATPGHCAQVQGANSALDATEVDPAQFVEGVASVE